MAWFIFSLIVFFLPGFFLVKIIYPKKENISSSLFISLAIFFSLAAVSVVFFLISLIKPIQLTFSFSWKILVLLNFLMILMSLKNPWPKIIFPGRKKSFPLIIIIFLSLLLLLAPYFRPHLGPFWSTYHFKGGRDIEKHISLIIGIKKFGLPPKNPFILNQPLNYYYFYHLDAAILSVLSNEVISAELSHLLLSASILVASSLLLSALLHPLICLILLLGYGFDFFPMVWALLKLHPYPGGLNHVDQWTIPFVNDLKVNPFSVWFAWVPQHTLAIFLFLIFVEIFFNLIKIKKHLKQIILGVLLFSILGTSAYIFIGGSAVFFLYFFWQWFKSKSFSNYQFLLVALPFCLLLAVPMALRIKTPALTFYPFWQLPRDHLLSWKFPHFSLPALIIILIFFLLERFFIYFFDLGIIFILAIIFWKKLPKTPFYDFCKVMLVISTLMSVLLKSVPFNNDLCYRVSGFSWLACAFLVNYQIEKIERARAIFWQKKFLVGVLAIILFSPTIVEQLIFPSLKISKDFWQLKKFVEENISQQSIIQNPPGSRFSTIYLLARKSFYYPQGIIFYPDPKEDYQFRLHLEEIFTLTGSQSAKLMEDYGINYLLTKNQDYPFTKSSDLKKIFTNGEYSLFSPGKQ